MAALEQTTTSFPDVAEAIEFSHHFERDAPPAIGNRLVVASYNIRYAVGRYLISSGLLRKAGLNPPFQRSKAVAANISKAAAAFRDGRLMPPADVVALQEADKRTARAGGIHVAEELADQLEMIWAHAPAGIPRGVPPKKRQWWLDFEEQIGLQDTGDTGVALLSRLPLKEVERIDLPWHECAWRPRLALGATVSVGGTELRLFNAHIDPHPDAKGALEQLETVVAQAGKNFGPTVVVGDFNTLSKQKCLDARGLLEACGYSTPFQTGTDTWRGAALRFHADWIFGRGIQFKRHGVCRPLNVSDHWPVWAEVEIG